MSTRSFRLCAVVAATAATLLGLAVPAAAADPSHDPVLNCANAVTAGQPLAAVFTGEAHAPAAHAASVVSITLNCRYTSAEGFDSWFATATANDPVVVLHDTAFLVFSEFVRVCESGSVTYSDGHVASVGETCRTTPAEVSPGPLPETAPAARCDHTRAPTVAYTWFIEATAVAGIRADAPVSTVVRCTLRDADGGVLVAEATAAGGVAVASNAHRVPVAALVSKCVEVTVVYLTSGTVRPAPVCEFF